MHSPTSSASVGRVSQEHSQHTPSKLKSIKKVLLLLAFKTSLYCSKVGDLSLKCCHPSLQASSSSYHRRLKISILQCIHRLDLQSSRCFSSRHSSRDAPRVIPPSDAPPVVTAEVDPRGCAIPHCSKKIDEMSLEYILPSLWASLSSEELNNDMYSSFGTTYNRHLQSTLDLYLLMLRVYNHTHFKPITPTPVNTFCSNEVQLHLY